MNRTARRAAQAQARRKTIDRITAVHEAGHAVARLLAAEDMGYLFEMGVDSIQIGTGPSWRSADGRIVLNSAAICYGPAVSKVLAVAYTQAYPGSGSISADEFNARLLTLGTAEQRAISGQAKMIVTAMGAAAEARLTGATWEEVFLSDPCIGDRTDFRRDARLAGFGDDDLAVAVARVRSTVIKLIAVPEVWSAIGAVASAMKGDLSGRQVALLAAPHIRGMRLSNVAVSAHPRRQ
ncbi:hypothetical protein [Mesorhizobium sp. B2-4-6]|uniref:hypothetical protein n=1 Tax=Mesorhizobium sp. B2-4-6 TaxID=2589943 RepID=UPI0011260150|nr:hypothetical protein [Mesorhizobium sp. B2-4-6]TPL51522.1 hypothetical protein FJ957_08000 [Mesorhizobium sp. B2-4-6]